MLNPKWFFAICLIIALAGVGAIVGNAVVEQNVVDLSPDVVRGHEIWVANGCENCHSLLGQGGVYAPDVTHIVDLRGATYLQEFFVNPSAFHPNERVMPRLNITRDEINALIAYLQFAQDTTLASEVPVVQVRGSSMLIGSDVVANDASSSSPEIVGRGIYSTRCASCHSIEKDVVIIGPSFYNLASRAETRVAGQTAETYIRNSILYPSEYLVEGYKDVMQKNFGEVLSSEDIDNVTAFLLTLKSANEAGS